MSRHPVAVIIADVHFSVQNLEVATSALLLAQQMSFELEVPLIVAGDLTDGKAIIRGEVANRLIELFQEHGDPEDRAKIIVGNHDLLNERSSEHSLNFLRPYCDVIQAPVYDHVLGMWLIPYQPDAKDLESILSEIPDGEYIIMHQGVQTAFMGHYAQDKTSLPPETFADFRVVSGHYHRRQDIKCGRPRKGAVGLFSYVGSPYTTTFAEANDGPKGISVLYSDGTLDVVPTHLRKHVIVERTVLNVEEPLHEVAKDDLVWIKVTGPTSELAKIKKVELGQKLLGHANFKFDKIPLDAAPKVIAAEKMTGEQIMDKIIDDSAETPEQKAHLKELWRGLL